MELRALFEDISYRLVGNQADMRQEIHLVTSDVGRAGPGVLFVCTRTPLHHGYDSAATAFGLGCRAFLCERGLGLPENAATLIVEDAEALLGGLAARCYGEPARALTVIGITGTAGKTSVAHTLTALLERNGRRVASLTTDGVRIGKLRRPAGTVVPDAGEIALLLREFVERGVEIAVLELSAYQLHHKAAFSIPFTALLLTNLMPAHIAAGEFRDLESYRAAKLSLFAGNAPFAVLPQGVFLPVIGRRVTFGETGDFAAEHIRHELGKRGLLTKFTLCGPDGEKAEVSLPVPGDFAVQNALAAAALAQIAGLELSRIARGLSRIQPKGRMQCVASLDGRLVYVDSAYEAEDLARVLTVLRERTEGRLSVVIGSVGGRAKWRRAALGRAAADYADFTYLTADDPDCEDATDICREMAEAGVPERSCIIPDRRRAIMRAWREMRPGDTLLIAGKGGCETQLIRGKRVRFLDADVVNEILSSADLTF